MAALLPLGTLLVLPGCGLTKPECPPSLFPYQDKCLSAMTIEYVGCTEGRGINTSNEISGGVGGSLRVAYAASVKAAYKTSQYQDPKVASQVIRDCLQMAKANAAADDPEQGDADSFLKRARKQQIAETPEISLSRKSVGVGESVRVTGTSFWPTETVDIVLHTATLAQVPTDDAGGFTATVTVPPGYYPANFPMKISVTGHSSIRTATAPIQVLA